MNIVFKKNKDEFVLSILDNIDPAECLQNMSNFDAYTKSERKVLLLQTLSFYLNEAETDSINSDLQ